MGRLLQLFALPEEALALVTVCQDTPVYLRGTSPQHMPLLAIMTQAEEDLHTRVEEFIAACEAGKVEFW